MEDLRVVEQPQAREPAETRVCDCAAQSESLGYLCGVRHPEPSYPAHDLLVPRRHAEPAAHPITARAVQRSAHRGAPSHGASASRMQHVVQHPRSWRAGIPLCIAKSALAEPSSREPLWAYGPTEGSNPSSSAVRPGITLQDWDSGPSRVRRAVGSRRSGRVHEGQFGGYFGPISVPRQSHVPASRTHLLAPHLPPWQPRPGASARAITGWAPWWRCTGQWRAGHGQ